MLRKERFAARSRSPIGIAMIALVLGGIAITLVGGTAWAQAAPEKAASAARSAQAPTATPGASPREVVVYASALPAGALSEFEVWKDAASPGGKLVGTHNAGGNLDPPPENDPHVIFKTRVEQGVPYGCWIHMKVGTAKGLSKANKFWVQFSNAVDQSNAEIFKPGTKSYLTAQGPEKPGWAWVPCVASDPRSPQSLVTFKTSGEITVRVQAGMEGVGFDQLVLSPARFLEKPPVEAVVKP